SLLGADAIGSGELRPLPAAAMDILPQITFPGIFDAESLSYWAAHWDEHPCVVRQLAGPEPRPLRLGDFVSERGLRRLGIYPAYRRLGLRGEIALQIHWEPDRMACVSAHRSGGRFGERERSLLAQLRPHLRAARSRIELSRQARRHRELLEAGLERGGVATALVDPRGRIVAASDGCLSLLHRWFDPPRHADRLPAELLAWRRRQSRRDDPAPLRRAAADRTLEVTASGADDGWQLLLRERRLGPPDAAALAAALPITQRQAEVLELISRGHADAAIANQLGISVRTVGHHVQHILGRLEVPSRTAAAAVALRVG
ncbi:MAG TPA: LuxR C-terminal-related transcriptional regulator, partial [Solirubrobacterales bacterium]|nr:LuxR C-terminal-related transcriptional regulator [Solirubrobacterales bacterium]